MCLQATVGTSLHSCFDLSPKMSPRCPFSFRIAFKQSNFYWRADSSGFGGNCTAVQTQWLRLHHYHCNADPTSALRVAWRNRLARLNSIIACKDSCFFLCDGPLSPNWIYSLLVGASNNPMSNKTSISNPMYVGAQVGRMALTFSFLLEFLLFCSFRAQVHFLCRCLCSWLLGFILDLFRVVRCLCSWLLGFFLDLFRVVCHAQ